uniref:Uncharacterized protein n=1 Tax=Cucumis melo TaxID=3656 RepID=A0A9I9CVB3_CUCME
MPEALEQLKTDMTVAEMERRRFLGKSAGDHHSTNLVPNPKAETKARTGKGR